jgi:hypothetical protein
VARALGANSYLQARTVTWLNLHGHPGITSSSLRPDVKSGELSLNIFAADLYDVAMGAAKPVYKDPKEFFSLTYPTFNLRELAKDVVTQLAEKAKRQCANWNSPTAAERLTP